MSCDSIHGRVTEFRNRHCSSFAGHFDNAALSQHAPCRRHICTRGHSSKVKTVGRSKLHLHSVIEKKEMRFVANSISLGRSGGDFPGRETVFQSLATLRTLCKRLQHVTKELLVDKQQQRITLANAGLSKTLPALAATGLEQGKGAIHRMLRGAALPYRYPFGG